LSGGVGGDGAAHRSRWARTNIVKVFWFFFSKKNCFLARLDHFADDGKDGAEAFVFRRRIIPGSTVRSALLG
jgi:hypothetical protein